MPRHPVRVLRLAIIRGGIALALQNLLRTVFQRRRHLVHHNLFPSRLHFHICNLRLRSSLRIIEARHILRHILLGSLSALTNLIPLTRKHQCHKCQHGYQLTKLVEEGAIGEEEGDGEGEDGCGNAAYCHVEHQHEGVDGAHTTEENTTQQ